MSCPGVAGCGRAQRGFQLGSSLFLAQVPPGVARFLHDPLLRHSLTHTRLSGRVSSSGMILGCPPNVVSSSVSLQSARPWGAPLITWRTGFHSFVVNYNRLLSVTKSLRGSSRCKVLSYCYLMSCGGPRIAPNPRFRPQKVFFPYRRRQIDNLASLSFERPVTRTKRRTSLLSCDNREQPDSTDNDHPTVINVLETHHRRPTSLQGIDQRPDDQYRNDPLYKRTTQITNKHRLFLTLQQRSL